MSKTKLDGGMQTDQRDDDGSRLQRIGYYKDDEGIKTEDSGKYIDQDDDDDDGSRLQRLYWELN